MGIIKIKEANLKGWPPQIEWQELDRENLPVIDGRSAFHIFVAIKQNEKSGYVDSIAEALLSDGKILVDLPQFDQSVPIELAYDLSNAEITHWAHQYRYNKVPA